MRSPPFSPALALAMLACGGDLPTGTLSICMDSDDSSIISETVLADGVLSRDISGEVTDVRVASNESWRLLDCDDRSTVVEVEDGAGVRWRIGIAVRDAVGDEVTPDLDLVPGTRVELGLRTDGEAAATWLTDDNGPIAAFDVDTDDTPIPGIRVDLGDRSATIQGGCGTRYAHRLDFLATGNASVPPDATAGLSWSGLPSTVRNIAAVTTASEARCPDSVTRVAWAAWR